MATTNDQQPRLESLTTFLAPGARVHVYLMGEASTVAGINRVEPGAVLDANTVGILLAPDARQLNQPEGPMFIPWANVSIVVPDPDQSPDQAGA